MELRDARETILESKRLLEKWTGKAIEHFAYPNGDYRDDILNIVRDIGFRSAVTTEARSLGPGANIYAIPRFGIGRYDNFNEFCDKARGRC